MRTIQSQFRPFSEMSYSMAPYGVQVLAEFEPIKGIRYALIHALEWRTTLRGPKTINSYSVRRFELQEDGFWDETSYLSCKTKAEAKKVFKATKEGMIN